MMELNNAIYNLKLSLKALEIINSTIKGMEDFDLKNSYLDICNLFKESIETVLKEVEKND